MRCVEYSCYYWDDYEEMEIRHADPIGLVGDYHPLAKLPLAKHPFGWDEKR